MSRMLGRSESSCRQRMRFLNIKVPKMIVENFKKESQFQKGLTPFNKGIKMEKWMSKESITRTKTTRFKQGALPKNTLYDGAVVIRTDSKTKRKYQWIRISKAKWKMLHVVTWEKINGRVPTNRIIVFKNGDSLDCKISNLEMITLKENMLRNTIHRYPEELKQTIRTLGKLKKTINGKK